MNEYEYYLDMIEIVGCCGKCFDLIRIPAGHLDKTFLLHPRKLNSDIKENYTMMLCHILCRLIPKNEISMVLPNIRVKCCWCSNEASINLSSLVD